MPDKQANQLSSIFVLLTNCQSKLGNLYEQAQYIQNLKVKLSKYLGPPLNEHCVLANYKNTVLVMHADSPAWATKLRFSTPAIISYMQRECHLNTLKTIRVKVIPAKNKVKKNPVRRLTLSNKSTKLIADIANSMTDHDLRSSLLKLTRHNN